VSAAHAASDLTVLTSLVLLVLLTALLLWVVGRIADRTSGRR
jgi:hypothetical protein